MEKIIKPYQVKDEMAVKANIKSKKTDKGGTFYVFDLYDEDGKLIAVDRYAFDGAINQPFTKPSKAEDCVVLKEKPDDKWYVAEIKEYMDLKEIEYKDELKADLLLIIKPEVEDTYNHRSYKRNIKIV